MKPTVCLLCALSLSSLFGCAVTGAKAEADKESQQSIYVEDISRVKDHKYFRIIEKIRCDEFDRTIFIYNPPDWTIGWSRNGRLVPSLVADRCIRALKVRYAEKMPSDNEGILVDGKTWELVGETRIGADAWLVKIVEPTQEDIRLRLRVPAKSPIDQLQLKATLRWIEARNSKEFTDVLRTALPADLALHPTRGWGEGETEVLRTIARMDNNKDELWLSILRAGIEPGLDPNLSFAPASGAHAHLAGRMIGCSDRKELVPELERILRGITIAPHKIAAGKALVSLGGKDIVKRVAVGMRPSPVSQQLKNMADAHLPYSCKDII